MATLHFATPPGFTPESFRAFQSAVVGMVLGDGTLTKTKRATFNSYFIGANIQEDYVQFKAKLLGALTPCKIYVQTNRRGFGGKVRGKPIWYFRSGCHPFYTALRQQFYPEGRKTVTPQLLGYLDNVGLALWYLDDGSLTPNSLKVRLATNCFNELEHETMIRELRARFGLRFTVTREKVPYKGQETQTLRLRLKAADREKFFDLVRPMVERIPSMLYKLPTLEAMKRIIAGKAQKGERFKEVTAAGEVQRLYVDGQIPLADLAKRFQVGVEQVRQALLAAGVKIRESTFTTQRLSERYDALLAPEMLLQLYVDQQMSADAIARQFEVCGNTVRDRLRKLGIVIRHQRFYRAPARA